MKDGNQAARNQRAWGQTIAAAPELRALMEHAREELAAGVSEEEVRRRILRGAQEEGLAGIGLLLPGLPEEVLLAPVPPAVQVAAEFFGKGWNINTVQDVADRISEAIGWDTGLVEFVLNWANTGEPGPVFAGFQGGVYSANIDAPGEQSPMVFLVATAISDLHALIEELRAVYQRTMPRASLRSVQNPEVQARRFRLFGEGKTDRQIARMEPEADGLEFRAVDDAEYRQQLRVITSRVKTARTRWRKRVTEMTDSV